MVDWVVSCRVDESCYVGSLTRGGWALVIDRVALPLKPRAISSMMRSSEVEGGGLLADGQT
jgi:hypothetical protein